MHWTFRALLVPIVLVLNGCGDGEQAPSFPACEISLARREERPIASMHMLVDGSGSMEGFLSPASSQDQPTTYGEMVYRVFSETPSGVTLKSWAFGEGLVFLGDSREARRSLLTRPTYRQEDSQLQDAFNATQAYFDSIFQPPGNPAAASPAPKATGARSSSPLGDSVHVVVILSDAKQSGDGPQLPSYAEIDRAILRHVERGGQLGVVARVAERYARSGAREPPNPVFAFIFAGKHRSDHVSKIAARLAAPVPGVPGAQGTGESRYVVFPSNSSTNVQFKILRGVGSPRGTLENRDFLWIVPNNDSLRVEARITLDSLSFASVAERPRVLVDRCTDQGWRLMPAGTGRVAFSAPALDTARTMATVSISRRGGSYVGSDLYRIRVHGTAVPDWVEAEFGARSKYDMRNLGRFFDGLRQIEDEPVMAAAQFYLRLDAS